MDDTNYFFFLKYYADIKVKEENVISVIEFLKKCHIDICQSMRFDSPFIIFFEKGYFDKVPSLKDIEQIIPNINKYLGIEQDIIIVLFSPTELNKINQLQTNKYNIQLNNKIIKIYQINLDTTPNEIYNDFLTESFNLYIKTQKSSRRNFYLNMT